jgi:hypothetical protein
MLETQDQGATLSDIPSIYNMIGQNKLALNCGTDRVDETTVLSHSFLRHHPPFALSAPSWTLSRELTFFWHSGF